MQFGVNSNKKKHLFCRRLVSFILFNFFDLFKWCVWHFKSKSQMRQFSYPKSFYVIQRGDKHQTFGGVHDTMMWDRGECSHQWRLPLNCILLLIGWFTWCNWNCLIETQTGTIMAICVDIGKYRDKKAWLLSFGGECPSLWLTKLFQIQINKQTNTMITISLITTHSIPSIKGESGQSFSGNRCNIIPLLMPLPVNV